MSVVGYFCLLSRIGLMVLLPTYLWNICCLSSWPPCALRCAYSSFVCVWARWHLVNLPRKRCKMSGKHARTELRELSHINFHLSEIQYWNWTSTNNMALHRNWRKSPLMSLSRKQRSTLFSIICPPRYDDHSSSWATAHLIYYFKLEVINWWAAFRCYGSTDFHINCLAIPAVAVWLYCTVSPRVTFSFLSADSSQVTSKLSN